MTPSKRRRTWGNVLLGLAIGCFVLSMPCVGLGVLGLLGIVADVSPAENRDMGMGLLRLALIPAAAGSLVLVVAIVLRRSK